MISHAITGRSHSPIEIQRDRRGLENLCEEMEVAWMHAQVMGKALTLESHPNSFGSGLPSTLRASAKPEPTLSANHQVQKQVQCNRLAAATVLAITGRPNDHAPVSRSREYSPALPTPSSGDRHAYKQPGHETCSTQSPRPPRDIDAGYAVRG